MTEENTKVSREMTVANLMGVHARPSMRLVDTINRFESEVIVEHRGISIDARSMMQWQMIAASYGTKLTVHACGPDANEVLDAIEELITERLED